MGLGEEEALPCPAPGGDGTQAAPLPWVSGRAHRHCNRTGHTRYVFRKKESGVTHLCPTFCDPMDCSLPGSSIHGIFQARVLEWVAISFSRGSSQPRD